MSKLAFLVAGTFFMEFLDATILTTALPRMAESMQVGAVDLNVGVSIYSLTIAVFILPSAWLVERFGARAVFTLAIVLFTLSSIACGFANTPAAFDLARASQGVGGALMVPVGRVVVLRTTAKTDLIRAVAIITWPGLTAPLVGPPLGGYLADAFSWRAIFFVNVPLGVVAAVLAWAWTPKLEPGPTKPFDLLGFGLAGGALACALFLLDRISVAGDGAVVIALALACVALAAAFVRHVRTVPHPILDPRPFRYPTFTASMVGGTAARVVLNAVPFVAPLMFQLGMGYDAVRSGLMLTPLFIGNIGIKPLTTPILRTFGFRPVVLVNAVIQIATLLGCALIGPETPWLLVAALLCVSGASRSMHFTSLNTLPFSDVPQDQMSMANLIFSVSFQASMAFGVGLGAAAIMIGGLLFEPAQALAPFRFAFVVLAGLMLLALLDHWRLAHDAGAAVAAPRRS